MTTTPTKTAIRVPLLDLNAQYATIKSEVDEAVHRVLDSGRFILGPEVQGLEEEVARYSQCAFGIGVASGTDALLLCLRALNIGPGDEVITCTYSFFASAGVIANVGARPVFVDIDPRTYNMDPHRLEAAITPRTKAVIAVHLYGQCCDITAIHEICKKRQVWLIEDAAQAIGAEWEGKRAGSIGDFGCFSFFPSKNLGGAGDGGMVVARARSPSTITRWWEPTAASTRCRRRSSASSCATSTSGARRGRATPSSTASCWKAPPSAVPSPTRGPATSTTSTSCACPSATA
jgi:dTDP-4-amino-4,6-dideoxygalactose transaminase